jgi:ABC-type multidrug transport system fused ATPase/permease subunit
VSTVGPARAAPDPLGRGVARYGVVPADRRRVAKLLALGAVGLGAGLLTPWLLARIVDDGILRGDTGALPWLAVTFVLALVAEEALGLAAALGRLRFGLDVAARLRVRLLDHYLRLRPDRAALVPGGDVLQQVGDHATAVQHFVADVLLPLPLQALTLLVVGAALVWLSPPLALVAVAALPALAFAAARLLPTIRERRRAAAAAATETLTFAQELLGRGRTLRVFGRTDWAARRFGAAESARGAAMARLLLAHDGADRLTRLGTGATTLVVLAVGALLVARGSLSLGALLAFNALLLRLFGPLRAALRARAERHGVETVLERFAALLAEPAEPPSESGRELPPDIAVFGFRRALRLENVRFVWPDGSEVLRGVDLTLRPGERLGLVGESGAGKSTLLDLLVRLQEPTGGALTLDGRPAADVDRASWRRHVRLLEQGAPLFAGTLRENVALGLPPGTVPDDGRVERALRLAGLGTKLAALPAGLETAVGAGGATLSGGERQRVALARALVSEPAVLLLDEPFTGVDDALRAELRSALLRLQAETGMSIVVVAHELDDVAAMAQRVVVLHEGRVVREAAPAELLARRAAHDRVAFPDAPPEALEAANAALDRAGLPARLWPARTGGLATEVERTRVDPLAVARAVREAVPAAARVVVERATLRCLL